MDNDMRVRGYSQGLEDDALGPPGRARPTKRDTEAGRPELSLACTPGPLRKPESDHEGSRAEREPAFRGHQSGNDDGQPSRGKRPSQVLLGPCWTDFTLFEPGSSRWSREAAYGSSKDSAFAPNRSFDEGTHVPHPPTSSSLATSLGDHGQSVLCEIGSWGTAASMPDEISPIEMFKEMEHLRREASPTGLPTPELSPLPGSFEFCLCCNHCEDGNGNTWHMSTKAKGSARMAWAKAYIEQMKSGDLENSG
ncbi:hypothetical protein HRG_001184 [Hirsutella rhossiliensis]|uniref:Uncharacterized protein n=1 Tax=Hirsutella rhossiliensis TaxID=111463 RepID=A0A9P8N8L6_9HYPO|nr:uncharacterized protein HRG_01184 [Hirsutella rhossiliensis]KAH0968542.1 hypothetical protein HRG_01184 [Hirsutella rhossiliensis]